MLPRKDQHQSGRIPSLDGLRAVSILLVLLHHGVDTAEAPQLAGWPLRPLVHNGQMGVNVFFVISGFLITTLLAHELKATRTINLRQFYLRRTLRIFPAFYIMLATMAVLAVTGVISLTRADLLAAGLFVWDYTRLFTPMYLAHTWSLSVEEQFYLVWPFVFLYLGPRRALIFALVVIGLSPLVRVATWYILPTWRLHMAYMFHTRLDMLMFGCAAALWRGKSGATARIETLSKGPVLAAAAIYILVLSPIMTEHFRGSFQLTLDYTLEGAAITAFMLGVNHRPGGWVGRFLNWTPVATVGLLSYSLYLWQQIFLFPGQLSPHGGIAVNLVGCVIAATMSFLLIERPLLTVRRRLSQRGTRGASRTEESDATLDSRSNAA